MHLNALKTPLLCLLAAGLTGAFIGQANAAGDAAATSGYLTIQPNAGNTGYVYTFSWVAPDTDNNNTGVTYTDTRFVSPAGNGAAELDDINGTGGNYDPDGAGPIVDLRYAWCMSTPGDDTTPANTATVVQWQDPANYGVGIVGPTVATPKFDAVGNFTPMGSYYLGSGVQGVTGVYGDAPDGSDALAAGAPGAIHQGIGFGVDEDGTDVDDFGPLIAGFDAVLDTTPTNTHPNTGYVRVEVPFGTAGDDFASRFFAGTYTKNAAVEVVVTTVPEGTYNAKLAVSGDFDSDLDVDGTDLGVVTGSITFGTGSTGYYYADGDTDADGDIDNADIGVVIGAITPSVSSGSADLTYDTVTGNVKLDASSAAGAIITSFQLENGAGSFIFNNYTSLSGGDFGDIFKYEDVTGSALGDSDPTNVGVSGTVDLGDVFPTGMDLAALQSYLTTAVFTGTAGSVQQEFNLVVTGVVSTEYETWAGGSVFDEDDNSDGIKNGMAFILGAADPDADATSLLPTTSEDGSGNLVLTFDMLDAANRGSATLSVEHSSDLGVGDAWTVVPVPDTSGGPTSGVTFTVSGSGTLDVTATISASEAADGKLFGRVSATE